MDRYLFANLDSAVFQTSNSASTAIYYIATNPGVQERLRGEARKVLPDKRSPVTMDTLENIPYLKAVIKESMRMMPIAVGNLRTTTEDVAIGGYRIPKGVSRRVYLGMLDRSKNN